MKRIVRLTESDLIRLVKRVINEQISIPGYGGGMTQIGGSNQSSSNKTIDPIILKCAAQHGLKEVVKYPTCFGVFTKILTSGSMPTNNETEQCKTELQKNGLPIQSALNIFTCILEKKFSGLFGL